MMYEEASQVASDAVRSIRTVASFCAQDKVMQLYRNKCDVPKKRGIQQGLISGIGFGVSLFSFYCVYAASFYAGAWLVKAEKTRFSDVFREKCSDYIPMPNLFRFLALLGFKISMGLHHELK